MSYGAELWSSDGIKSFDSTTRVMKFDRVIAIDRSAISTFVPLGVNEVPFLRRDSSSTRQAYANPTLTLASGGVVVDYLYGYGNSDIPSISDRADVELVICSA